MPVTGAPTTRPAAPAKPSNPPDIMFRVVSLPATRSCTRNMPNSASVKLSPSISAAPSSEMMPSPGVGPALGGRSQQIGHHLRAEGLTLLLGPVGGTGDDRLGPAEELGPLVLGHSHQVTDHLQRKRDRHLGHDVDRLAGLDAWRPGPGYGPARSPPVPG